MEKKSFRLVALVFLILLGVVLFLILRDDDNYISSTPISDATKFKEEYEAINSVKDAVQITIDEVNPIKYLMYDELEKKLISEESFVLYLGFPTCPWCRNIINPLFDVAKTKNKVVYYINVRDLKNSPEQYDKLYNLLYEYLQENADGVKTLYVPDVYFFKGSKVVGHHLGSVDSQENPYISLNDEQIEELKNIYIDLFNELK